jgi:hypothetical protein
MERQEPKPHLTVVPTEKEGAKAAGVGIADAIGILRTRNLLKSW